MSQQPQQRFPRSGRRPLARLAAGLLLGMFIWSGTIGTIWSCPAPVALAQTNNGDGEAEAGAQAGDNQALEREAWLGAGGRFGDISDHWSKGYVDAMLQAGIITVPEDGLFHPEESVTRLDFAVWVARAMELAPETPAEPPFTDWESIPEADRPWVAAAVREGLISGYPEPGAAGSGNGNVGGDGNGEATPRSFRPGNRITRAELGTIFGRALIKLGLRPEDRFLYLFQDRAAIPEWAATPAAAAVKAEIILGRTLHGLATFAPGSETKRSEAAAMINRFLNARAKLLPQLPPAPKPSLKRGLVTGYYYRGSMGSYDSLAAHGDELDLLFYFSYQLDAAGNLLGFPVQRDLALAAEFRLPVLAVVTNLNFSLQGAHSLLTDDAARQKAVAAVLGLMEQGYAGINLDFENVDPADRDAYTRFVGELSQALRPRGYLVTAAVPARTARTAESAWGRAYDYRYLGRFVDYLVIMTYDQHWSGSPPGPVGGADWAEDVVSYAASVMPPEKVLLGIPSYARDWPDPAAGATGSVKARPIRDWDGNDGFYSVEELVAKHGVQPFLDLKTAESSFRYVDDDGIPRVLYYTETRGLRLKLDLINKYRLGGAAMWRIGFEPPEYWSVFSSILDN